MIDEKSLAPATLTSRVTLRRIQIEPTNRCNFKCGYCRRTHWTRPDGDMTLGNYMTLLDRLPSVSRIHLQGVGEPLLNRDFFAMVRHTRKLGINISTSSNASTLTSRASQELLDTGINRVNISLDTIDPEEFARIRPGAPISKILENIATLANLRNKGNYLNTGLALAVVAQQSTIANLPKIVELAAELGVNEVYVQNLNGIFLPDDYVLKQRICVDDDTAYLHAKQLAENLATRLNICFLAPDLDQANHESRCGWPFAGCNITWDGFVSPCCLQPDPDILHFGNLFEMSFEQIWNSPAYERFRADVRADHATICTTCPDRRGQMWHPLAAPLPTVKHL